MLILVEWMRFCNINLILNYHSLSISLYHIIDQPTWMASTSFRWLIRSYHIPFHYILSKYIYNFPIAKVSLPIAPDIHYIMLMSICKWVILNCRLHSDVYMHSCCMLYNFRSCSLMSTSGLMLAGNSMVEIKRCDSKIIRHKVDSIIS